MNDTMDAHILTAVKAALAGGEAILGVYGTAFEVDMKADSSPLTEADRQAHTAIMGHLNGTGLPVLSEEGRDIPFAERSPWKEFWLVDPLDGTKELVKRNGEFTVNIALIADGAPVAGIIYVPVKRVLYVGIVGRGAFRWENITDLATNDLSALIAGGTHLPAAAQRESFTVVGSRSHMSQETMDFVESLKEAHGEVEMVSMGSSLKLCLVAEGTADVYPRFAPTMEWDTAAGHAIAVAAGCSVTMQDGRTPLLYNKENLLNPWFIVSR